MDFIEYWQYTDAVSKTLFFVLFALSICSWIVGILRIMGSLKLKSRVSALTVDNLPQSQLQTQPTPQEAIEQRLLQNIGRIRHQSEKGLAILGTTASIAPFVGLFGTVWGIFHALNSIAYSGQAGLAQVAGPVGEALIMTGLGLAVAIPAVIFYNIATRINRNVIYLANDTAYGVLANAKNAAVSQPKSDSDTANLNKANHSTANQQADTQKEFKEGSYGV